MKFLEAVWARFTTNDVATVDPGVRAPAPDGPVAAAQTIVRPAPRAGIEGLAVRCAAQMEPGTLADPERVKWVLLQPEVAACALRFASLARLGTTRAEEARVARDALRALLGAELPSEAPINLELLLDSMQAGVRWMPDAVSKSAAGPPAAGEPRTWTAEVPEVVGEPSPPGDEPHACEPPPFGAAVTPPPRPDGFGMADMRPVAATPPVAYPPEAGAQTAVEYESHVLPGTTGHDLDEDLVREYVQGSTRRRSSALLAETGALEVMHSVQAIDGPAGRERLTVLGALFFAEQPERLLVQSKVRFVEFPGVEVASTGEKVAYRYSEEITGTIPQLIARMERLHKERLAPGVLADGFRVEEVPALPLFALREAIVNAVCHRDYSLVGANIQVRLFADRLEVQSPGGLPGPVTVENILTESYARNPRVADILRDLGYVERHGLGIDNMFTSMEESHLPPPEFSNTATSFTVTLRFRAPDEADPESWLAQIGACELAPECQKALVFARRMGRIDPGEYQSLSGAEEAEARRHLRRLVRDGWLLQHGTRGAAHYTLGPSAGPDRVAAHENPLPRSVLDSLPKSQRRILDIVARHGAVKVSEVLDISALKDRRTVQRTLAALARRGLVVRRASSPTDPSATYEIDRDFHENDPPTGPASLV